MSMVNMKIKKLHPDAILPTKSHKEDLGIDFYALETTTVLFNKSTIVKTGIAIELDKGYGLIIKDRSSKAYKSQLFTVAGVIDNGYRGEIGIVMITNNPNGVVVKKGEKIAQGIVQKIYDVNIKEVDELSDTKRGEKGYGSTGN